MYTVLKVRMRDLFGSTQKFHNTSFSTHCSWKFPSGHTNTITGLRLSPDGNYVLSNAMDSTVRIWDVRPFANQRLERTFVGNQHGFEKNLLKVAWTPDGKHIASGSADRNVYVWNVASGEIEYQSVTLCLIHVPPLIPIFY